MSAPVPMKVIKLGLNTAPRIAQACDRCRSKKIRCDGIRPTCTQCGSVGFECRTSDKLSRRAFPRGYTESLEDRVRSLETEVRHLKDLLAEKDREPSRISQMHTDQSGTEDRVVGSSPSYPGSIMGRSGSAGEGTFFESILTPGQDMPGTRFQWFEINRLNQKLFNKPDIGLQTHSLVPVGTGLPKSTVSCPHPPKAVTDKLVDLFFRTWEAIFPILSRARFMEYYNLSLVDRHNPKLPPYALAQIFLVLSLAENSQCHDHQPTEEGMYYTRQWESAMDGISTLWKSPDSHIEPGMSFPVLQTLLLAAMECLHTTNDARLSEYMTAASTLCLRLELPNSQDQRTDLTNYQKEVRKRVFWCYYTIECAAAVQLEQEMRVAKMNISCEFPDSFDDSNDVLSDLDVSKEPPLWAALGMFRLARILVKVWADIGYPFYTMTLSAEALTTRLITFQNMLEGWLSEIPSQIRVQKFLDPCNDLPAPDHKAFVLCFAFYSVSSLIPKVALRMSEWTSLSASHILICKQALQVSAYLKKHNLNAPILDNYPYQTVQFILPIISYAIDNKFGPDELEEMGLLVNESLLYLKTTSASNAAAEISILIDKVCPQITAALVKVSTPKEITEDSGDVSLSEWTELVGRMDAGDINIYDNIYGGPGGHPQHSSTAKIEQSHKKADKQGSKPPPQVSIPWFTPPPPLQTTSTTTDGSPSIDSAVSITKPPLLQGHQSGQPIHITPLERRKKKRSTNSSLHSIPPTPDNIDRSLLPDWSSTSQSMGSHSQSFTSNPRQPQEKAHDMGDNMTSRNPDGQGGHQIISQQLFTPPMTTLAEMAPSLPTASSNLSPTFQFVGGSSDASSSSVSPAQNIPQFAPSIGFETKRNLFMPPPTTYPLGGGGVRPAPHLQVQSHLQPFSRPQETQEMESPQSQTQLSFPTASSSSDNKYTSQNTHNQQFLSSGGISSTAPPPPVYQNLPTTMDNGYVPDGSEQDLSAILETSNFNFDQIYQTIFSRRE